MKPATIIHHSGSPPELVADWYETLFDRGIPGDWLWIRMTEGPAMLMIVPLVGLEPGEKNRLEQRGGELVHIFMNRLADDWAVAGPVNGWDGNVEAPTLNGSVWIRGREEVKGWHGFVRAGKLVNLDGSIVGA